MVILLGDHMLQQTALLSAFGGRPESVISEIISLESGKKTDDGSTAKGVSAVQRSQHLRLSVLVTRSYNSPGLVVPD